MYPAVVKYPYKKEWEKDMGYGLSAPITFVNEEIGEYKQYINANDPKKQWIKDLKKGDKVSLVANPNGNGYIIKQSSAEEPRIETNTVKDSARILGQCIREIETELKEAEIQFTSEDVRSLAISMFIQLMRAKRSGYDYSVN